MNSKQVVNELKESFLTLNDEIFEAGTPLKEAQAYKRFKDKIADLLYNYREESATIEEEKIINININFK